MIRLCSICGLTKPLVQGTWVFKRGKPEGTKCLKCTAALRKARLDTNPAERSLAAERTKQWLLNNHEYHKALCKAWYYNPNNHSKTLKVRKVWYHKNISVAKQRQAAWRLNNGPVKNAHSRRYMMLRRKACPKWLSSSDIKLIEGLYIKAQQLTRETGVLHHVDHIVPIQGKLVSGLHVPWNLQVLTTADNLSKSNKF